MSSSYREVGPAQDQSGYKEVGPASGYREIGPVETAADSVGGLRQAENTSPMEGPSLAAGPVAQRAAANLGTSGGAEKIGRTVADDPMQVALRANAGEIEPFRSISRAQLGAVQGAGELAGKVMNPQADVELKRSLARYQASKTGQPPVLTGETGTGENLESGMKVAGGLFAPISEPVRQYTKANYDKAGQALGVPPEITEKISNFAGDTMANAALALLPHAPGAPTEFRRPTGGLTEGVGGGDAPYVPLDELEKIRASSVREPQVVPETGQPLPTREQVTAAANAPPPRNVPRDANVEVPEQAPPEPARGHVLDQYGRDARQEILDEQLREIEARARARGIDASPPNVEPPLPPPYSSPKLVEPQTETPRRKIEPYGPPYGEEQGPPAPPPRPQGLLPPRRIITPPPGEASSSMERPPGINAAGKFRRTLLPGELRGGPRLAQVRVASESPQEARPPEERQAPIFGQEVPPPPKEPTEEPLPEQLPEEPEFQTEEGPVVRSPAEEERLAMQGAHEEALPEIPDAREGLTLDEQHALEADEFAKNEGRRGPRPLVGRDAIRAAEEKAWRAKGKKRGEMPEAFANRLPFNPWRAAELRAEKERWRAAKSGLQFEDWRRQQTAKETQAHIDKWVAGGGPEREAALRAQMDAEDRARAERPGGLVDPSGNPILSPQASEAQRALEEHDAAVRAAEDAQRARLKAEFESRPKGPTEQAAIFGRTDLGRKLDQRDLPLDTEQDLGPPPEEVTQNRAAYEKFAKAQEDYRSRRIGDDEFLAARAEYDKNLSARDAAEKARVESFDPEVQKRLDAEEAAFEAERKRAKGAKDEFPSAATEKAIQKAPFSEKMGLAIKRLTSNKKATEGAQQFYDEKLAKKNQGSIFNPFKWGERHGQNQTMKAAPEIAQQARKAAYSSAAAQYRVAVAYERIGTEVGPEWQQKFADTMSESQQRGQRVKYGDLRDQFANADPADVPDLYKDHGVEALVDLDERRPGGSDAATKLYARFEAAKMDKTKEIIGQKMKDLLVRAFDSAAKDVTPILPDAEYQANLKAPEFKKALGIAKQEFLDDLADAHQRNSGKTLSPAHLGEVGTYWPMTGQAASDLAKRQIGGGSRGPFVKPLNPLNKKRKGLSDAYDTSWEAVARKASAGFRADEHAHLLNLAESRGLLTKLPPGQGAAATYDFDGVTYVGAGDGTYAMPKWFRDEMGPILDKPPRTFTPETLGSEFSRGVLATNTAALVDKTFHYINAVGTQAAFNPALGSRASQIASHILPGFKTTQAMAKLFRSVGPEESQMVRDMLDNGEWYPRFDESTGVLTSMSKRDMATRLDMRKGILETRPDATPNELYEAATRFGEYNKLLETEKVRLFKEKHNMIAPFVTAGTTMRGNAVQSLKMGLGTTGGLRSALQGGLPMALGSWIGVHALVTKIREGTARIPDPTSDDFKFGGVPIGETDDGRTMFLNVMRASAPMANRGFSATGIKAFAETLSRSDEDESADVRIGQAVAAMTQDLVNAGVHPFVGPAPKVVTRATLGVDPQIEKRSGNWQFRNAHEPTMPGMETYRANLRSARDAMNPLLEKTLPGMTRGENAEPEPYSYLDKNRQPRNEPLFGESAGADENAGIPAWAIPLRWLGLLQVENIEGHKAGLRREPRNVAKEKRSFQKREFRKEGP